MNWDLFAAFLLITAVLVITPGPIVTLVIATGAREGTRAALITVVGTTLGNAVLLAAIAFGLSWVVRNAVMLFEVLRWIGAAYLIWLGIQAWRHAGETGAAAAPRGQLHVWRGFAVALSNPKSIAFFTAFLPQFVDPALPVEPQLALMCAVSVVLAAFTDSAWAAAAGLGRAWFMHSW
jgi:threonine/homoserine/homoserine lactone efflux protein